MKYKLINTNTKEESICEKITIDGFDYYVGDEQPVKGWYYDVFINKIRNTNGADYGENEITKQVIATSNPSINIPKVINEVEIEEFAWEEAKIKFTKEEGREPNINNEKDCNIVGFLQEGIIHGYNKSKKLRPFSEEDVVNFGEWLNKNASRNIAGTWGYFENRFYTKTTTELFQIWKEQQPKIIYYR